MEVRSCIRCKKLFNYIRGQSLCPSCKEEIENKFQDVKKYLDEHKGASIIQISEDCDVEEHIIKQWIRDERLEFSSGLSGEITCEICGKPITTGRFCDKCKNETISAFNNTFNLNSNKTVTTDKGKASPKMRFLDNN